MEKLITLLKSLAQTSPALIEHLRTIIKPFAFKKGETILEAGQISNLILYIEEGLVLSYYKLGNKEISNWFMGKGELFISVLSFHRRTASLDTHLALKNCKCWGITHDELEKTCQLFPEFERHGRILEAEYYCLSEERHIMIKRQPSAVKYQALLEQYPELPQYATIKQLASFLNMGTRTFNSMRQKFSKGNGKGSII